MPRLDRAVGSEGQDLCRARMSVRQHFRFRPGKEGGTTTFFFCGRGGRATRGVEPWSERRRPRAQRERREKCARSASHARARAPPLALHHPTPPHTARAGPATEGVAARLLKSRESACARRAGAARRAARADGGGARVRPSRHPRSTKVTAKAPVRAAPFPRKGDSLRWCCGWCPPLVQVQAAVWAQSVSPRRRPSPPVPSTRRIALRMEPPKSATCTAATNSK